MSKKKYISVSHKLYPTKEQDRWLADMLWHSIAIENWCLTQLRHTLIGTDAPEKWGLKPYWQAMPVRALSHSQAKSVLSKRIKYHSKKCGLPSRLLNDCIGHVCESVKRHKNVFKLKWKSARKKRSFYFQGDMKIDKRGRLKLPGLKTSIRMSEMNKFFGSLKKVTIIKEFDHWRAVCVYESETSTISPICPTDSREAGIDPGLKDALVLSDGTKIGLPKFYRDACHKIGKLQRKSKNSKKHKRLQRKIKNRRLDHHHKLSTEMARVYEKIYWSDDNFAAMKRMKRLGKSYSDFALGLFRDLLKAKLAARQGGVFMRVSNRRSTQTCSACGYVEPQASRLEVREWTCSGCGTRHDRDVNAAINTLLSGRGTSADQGKPVRRKSRSSVRTNRQTGMSGSAANQKV